MTVQHSPFSLSDIAYHLYTIFLFTENDVLTAIIPVVGMALLSLCRCSHHNVPDIVFDRLCTTVQHPPSIVHCLVDLAPYAAIQPRKSDQGTRRRQGQQAIEATSSRQNHSAQRDDPPLARCSAVPGLLFALQPPISVCQSRDAAVYHLVQ